MVHAREQNRHSARVVLEWLDCVESYLEGGTPDAIPLHKNHKKVNVKRITDDEFDGIPMATLVTG
jgi:hypothetical protein